MKSLRKWFIVFHLIIISKLFTMFFVALWSVWSKLYLKIYICILCLKNEIKCLFEIVWLISFSVATDFVQRIGKNGGKCLLCGRVFSIYTNARRHYQFVHAADESDASECHLCKKVYKSQPVLVQHLRNMHGVYKSAYKESVIS